METSPTTVTLVQNDEDERRKMRIAMFWVVVCAVVMVGYAFYSMDQVRKNRRLHHEQKMQQAVAMFPRNPYEYNERQRKAYATNYWRRFNIRNITLLCVSILGSIAVTHWHRKRRAMILKRKTVAFWMWSCLAGLLGVAWGVYVFKQGQKPLVSKIKRNPFTRGLLYIGCILLVALVFYIYRLGKRKSKKQAMLEAWRRKKHVQMMQKARDIDMKGVKAVKMTNKPNQ